MSEPKEQHSTSNSLALRVIVVGLIIAILVVVAFAFHERKAASQLSAQNQQMASVLKDTQAQVEGLNAKFNALNAPQPPLVVRPSAARRVVVHRRADDPRWKKMQTQLDAQGRAIDSTRQDLDSTRNDLTSARTELSGSIARTHDELVLLQKKGERNYTEFDLDKSKQFRAEGPVGMRLKKADSKHQYADLELTVDDVRLSQKHINLLQPVVFYAAEGGQPVELVINRIGKNHIHGYVSEPKYKHSELAAMTSANAASAPASTPAQPPANPPTRRKLELPK